MKFVKSLLTVLTVMLPVLSWSQINTEDYIPFRDIEATDTGIVVTYMFRGGIHQPDPLHQDAKFWKIPGFGLNDNATEPGFPFRWDSFTIPDDAEVNVTLLDSVYTDTLFALAPAYPPLLNSDTIGYTPERVPLITPYTGFYPNTAVLKGDIQSYRGQGIVRVATLPIQYNYQTGTVRSFSMIRYLVSFTDKNTRATIRGRNYVSERADNNISLSDHFLENITLNYRLSDNGRRNIQTRTGSQQAELDNRSYLIITTNDFLNAVNEFAEWKRTKGFNVIIESRDQGEWTYEDVHNIINYHYITNSSSPLYFLLFFGDIEFVPAQDLSYYNHIAKPFGIINYVSDYNYAIDIGEISRGFPVCFRARISVKNETEALIVVRKIINYENNPPELDYFYNTCSVCSIFESDSCYIGCEQARFILTSEEIRNHLMLNGKNVNRIYNAKSNVNPLRWNNYNYSTGDSIPEELRRSGGFQWNGNNADVINNMNLGNFLFLYNGHGESFGWLNIDFYNPQIPYLLNGNKQPVIMSMGCKTGKYDVNSCFTEDILKKENGGCVGIIGASESSFAGIDDVLVEAMIDAVWPGLARIEFPYQQFPNNTFTPIPTFELGQIIDQGINVMRNNCYSHILGSETSQINTINYATTIYHLFGDPSMMIYTEKPVAIEIPIIKVNGNIISVQTTDGESRISFHALAPYSSNVKSFVGNYAEYSTTADSVIICIDRHNCIPYVVTYHKNEFIQNETINDNRNYVGKNIKVGRNVTTTKPVGDVVIDGADVMISGGDVELHPGTTIINSKVLINP